MVTMTIAPAPLNGDNSNPQERVVTIMPSLLASKWKSCINKVEVILVDTKLETMVNTACGGHHPPGANRGGDEIIA
jgi:hypothetical protein